MISIASRLSLARPVSCDDALRCVDHPCEEFLDRRQCFAVSTNPARATTDATRAALRETHLHAADRRALHRPGLLMPCQALSKCAALLGGGSTIRVDDTGCGGATTVALVSAGLSQDAGRRRQNAQQSRGHNAACIDRGRSNVSRQRWHGASRAGTEHKIPGPMAPRLWNRPYTLWRADRPAICGRNAVVH